MIVLRTSAARLTLLWLLLSLAGCGFHLRGETPIAPAFSPLLLQADTLTEDQQAQLRRALTAASAIVVDSQRPGVSRLRVSLAKVSQRNLASSNASRFSLVQVDMTLQYQLFDLNGKDVFGPREISQSVQIERDDDNLLVHQQQLEQAEQALFQQLLVRMISHLSNAA